ncbi:hypothetical protein EP30_10125 [Bifidobacterium sp. UTCIF-39]|uniref:DUF3825 domain-containing protein n=1 Tax=Bifidobacterium sp. UTCIF-39 TaxID=1465359 RepID=UPI0011292E18|nr:DUF3825 domain-containing protein [Bifidobacterium sp. UTCIF-39]TPF95873.1 hypothetical protein EP30_10125 [Bifidobacterium sp. UTCIF-39]
MNANTMPTPNVVKSHDARNSEKTWEANPRNALFEFAWIKNLNQQLATLADMALPEPWSFERTTTTRNYDILLNYLQLTFYRLSKEGKILKDEGKFACFNTGLMTPRLEDLYAAFVPNENCDRQEWRLDTFCTEGRGYCGKEIVRRFPMPPQRARFFSNDRIPLFDPNKGISLCYEHILIERMNRLPISMLENEIHDPSCLCFLDDMKHGLQSAPGNVLRFIENDQKIYRSLKARLDSSVECARKMAQLDYQTVMIAYYPRTNGITLLMPLHLTDRPLPDVYLALEPTSGKYIGQTILTPEMAYKNARLIRRPVDRRMQLS